MFNDDYFSAVGLNHLSDEQKQELADQLGSLVMDRVAVRLMEVLDEQQAEQFANLMEKDQDEEAFGYLQEVYPGYGDLMAEEIGRAQDEFLSDIETVASELNARPVTEEPSQPLHPQHYETTETHE